ncbi:hypothetical protein ACVNRC_37085 (plasmid) [Burkholderia pyrrocinia]
MGTSTFQNGFVCTLGYVNRRLMGCTCSSRRDGVPLPRATYCGNMLAAWIRNVSKLRISANVISDFG